MKNMNDKTLTDIELLKKADTYHEKTHQDIMKQFKELNEENKKEHGELFEAVHSIKSSIDTLPEKLDERYASKATETNQRKMAWLVISTVVIALLALVIKG